MSDSSPKPQQLGLSGPLTAHAVHLCVDMQRLFSSEGPWPTPWMDRTLPRMEEIAGHHPRQTVFTRFIPPRRPEDMPGRWRAYYEEWRSVTREHVDPRLLDLVPALAAYVPPAVVVDKPVYSPFTGWRLLALLRERKADALSSPARKPISACWQPYWAPSTTGTGRSWSPTPSAVPPMRDTTPS